MRLDGSCMEYKKPTANRDSPAAPEEKTERPRRRDPEPRRTTARTGQPQHTSARPVRTRTRDREDQGTTRTGPSQEAPAKTAGRGGKASARSPASPAANGDKDECKKCPNGEWDETENTCEIEDKCPVETPFWDSVRGSASNTAQLGRRPRTT